MRSGIMVLAIIILGALNPAAGRSQMKVRAAWTSFASNMSGAWAIGSTRSFIKTNEEMTRRFVRGYSEGVQFLKANKAAGIRAIQKYARIKDPEILEATYGEARAYIETVPYVTRKGMEAIIAELLPTEPKAKTAKPDDFLDTRFVSQLEREGFYRASASR